jgi:glycosidase
MAMAAAAAQLLRTAWHPGADGEGRNAQFWRQRDTQRLLDWLHDDARRLINAPAITAWLAELPASPVRAMLDEAVPNTATRPAAPNCRVSTSSNGLPNGDAKRGAGRAACCC